VSFALTTINPVIAGQLAHLHARDQKAELQQLLTMAVRVCLLLSLPVGLLELAGGDRLLGLFGDDFGGGATALRILVLAQLINSAAGSVGLLLNMSGHAGDTLVGTALSAVAGFVLSISLIPRFGINGAALAQGSGIVVFNVWLALRAYQRLGLNTTILPGMPKGAG
jgi:O-antigen/teichoic acid export membrane protein